MFNRQSDADQAVESAPEAEAQSAEAKGNGQRYPDFEEGFVNINGAAEHLGISPNRIRSLLKDGRIPGAEKQPPLSGEGPGRWAIPTAGLDEYAKNKGSRSSGAFAWVAYVKPGVTDEQVSAVLTEAGFGLEDEPVRVVRRYKPKPKKEAAE